MSNGPYQADQLTFWSGGTPCQSFSVAGLRRGLDDPRGGLMLTFLKIAQRLGPRWIVWENVPGVLSSNGGRDFGSFLGALGELGYGWAYRVLDAQWFGVAQRRRRVFVVGCLGDGAVAAKVLFESESVRRDSPPSREKGKGIAADAQDCAGERGVSPTLTKRMQGSSGWAPYNEDAHLVPIAEKDVVGCLSDGAHMGGGLNGQDAYTGRIMAVAEKKSHWEGSGVHPTLNQSFNTGAIGYSNQELFSQGRSGLVQALYENHPNDSRVTGPHEVAPSCVSGFGTGGGNVPLVQEAIPFDTTQITSKGNYSRPKAGDPCHPIASGAHPPAIAFKPGIAKREGNDSRLVENMSPTLRKDMGDNQVAVAVDVYNQKIDGDKAATLTKACGGTNTSGAKVMAGVSRMAVRRLTPKECERLQGFPDEHTLIPWRNKPADQCPDGPRYKALGNSMAVPCMAWIGKRIDAVDRANRKNTQ